MFVCARDCFFFVKVAIELLKAIKVPSQSNTGSPTMANSSRMLKGLGHLNSRMCMLQINVVPEHDTFCRRHTVESITEFTPDRPASASSRMDMINMVSKCFRC